MARITLLVLVSAAFALPCGAAPRRYSFARALTAPVPEDDAYFGWAVAPHGTNLVVTALLAESDHGAAYLFHPATGTILQTYSPGSGGAHEFGTAVAVVGDTVVVGAPAQTGGIPGAGAAYVFDVESGALLRTLTNPSSGSEFGYAVVAFNGNVLVSARTAGNVYLFDGATGALLRTFTNPGYPYDSFGASIAAVGSNVVVGAPAAVRLYSGLAYLFDGGTGTLLRTITNPTPDAEDGFGQVVGALGGDLLVGDPYDSTDSPSSGQVHRFDPATGTLRRTYHSPAGPLGTFGYGALADVDGDLLAGAPGDRALAVAGGAAYLLDGATGAMRARFLPPSAMDADIAGYTVNTVGTYVVVPAPYADTPTEDEGIVYLFERCGSGIVDGSEECDDGNTVDGDGCSSLCFVEPCTPAPPAGCSAPAVAGGAKLVLKDAASDALTWQWRRGTSTLADLGDPTSTSHYELCIWDASGGPQPRFARTIPAGDTCGGKPCWQAKPGQGFVFKDAKTTLGNLTGLTLRAGQSSPRIVVKGRGGDLGVPAPPLTPPVTVQLHNVETGACWGAAFATPSQNQPGRFAARGQ